MMGTTRAWLGVRGQALTGRGPFCLRILYYLTSSRPTRPPLQTLFPGDQCLAPVTLGVLRVEGQKTPSTPSTSCSLSSSSLPRKEPNSLNYRDREEERGLWAGATGAEPMCPRLYGLLAGGRNR